MLCRGTTSKHTPCKRIVSPKVKYCRNHFPFNSGQSVAIIQPVTGTNITQLSPDLLQRIAHYLPAYDITRLTRVSKQFQTALDDVFWRKLAHHRELTAEGNGAYDTKRLLANHEDQRRVINVFALIRHDGLCDPTHLPDFFVEENTSLESVYQHLIRTYTRYLNDIIEHDELITVEEFRDRLSTIRDYDILDITVPMYDKVPTAYLVHKELHSLRVGEDYLFLDNKAFPLLRRLHRRVEAPLTERNIQQIYPDCPYKVGFFMYGMGFVFQEGVHPEWLSNVALRVSRLV